MTAKGAKAPKGLSGETPPQVGLPTRTLATLLGTRLFTNMSFRVLYPFLPAVARGLGVSLATAGTLASVQGGVRMLAPFFGSLSDRYGRRRLILASAALILLATGLIAISRSFAFASLAFALLGIGRAIFDPAVHAYVGDSVPYAARARPFAIISLAWALSWLVGVPASGLLIEHFGWSSPWVALSMLLALSLVVLRQLPAAAPVEAPPREGWGALAWWRLLRRRQVLAAMGVAFGLVFAMENIVIVYGAFLEGRFALSVGAIGVLSVVTGVAELLAEGSTFAWTDRIGKKRSVTLGLLAFSASLICLPWIAISVITSLAAFALVFFCFEFTMVSFFPLMSEVAPDARGTSLSMNVAAVGLSRLIAPLLATVLFARSPGLQSNALLSAFVCLASAGIAWRFLPD